MHLPLSLVIALSACASLDDVDSSVRDPAEPSVTDAADLPDTLTRDIVRTGVDALASEISRCGDRMSTESYVAVKVHVTPAGAVSRVTLRERSPSLPEAPTAVSDCVVGAMARATFAATRRGGSFSYPFRFATRT